MLCMSAALEIGHARPAESLILIASRQNSRFRYNDLYLIDLDHCRRHRLPLLSVDDALAWSPDGDHIAFLSTIGGGVEIHVADWTGANLREVTQNFTTDTHVAFRPDGGGIIYTGMNLTEVDVIARAFDETDEHILTPPGSVEMSPTYAPDSRYIVYVESGGGYFHLGKLDLVTGEHSLISVLDSRWTFTPQIAPDGSLIAFVSTNTSYSDYRLHLISPDGEPINDFPLIDDTQGMGEIEWLPSGESVAFLAFSAQDSIYLIDRDGSNLRRVPCLPDNVVAFAYPPR